MTRLLPRLSPNRFLKICGAAAILLGLFGIAGGEPVLPAAILLACLLAVMFYLWQTSRKRTREIEILTSELEQRIAERTQELDLVNRTFEASVEHERQALAMLRERESQLRGAFEAGGIGTWSVNLLNGEVDWQGQNHELFGLPPDAMPLPPEKFLEAIHLDDREHVQAAVEDALAGNREYDTEFRIVRPDGTVRWIAARGRVSRDRRGVPERFGGVNIDITARKQAEAALLESESVVRRLADALPHIVWTSTPEGSIEYVNQAWHEYSGRALEEMRGIGWLNSLHPDDHDGCAAKWAEAVAGGTRYEVEFRLRRGSDGAFRWHLGRAVPVRNFGGEIVRWFGTCTDIEDHKRVETAIRNLNETLEDRVAQRTAELAEANHNLARTRADLQNVLDAATGVSIIATDQTGLIRVFNSGAERMLQYSASEMIGKHTPEIIHEPGEYVPRARELSERFGRDIQGFDVLVEHARLGGSEEREWTYVRKDGSQLDVLLCVTAVRDAAGEIAGYLAIAADISSRKALERELR